MAEFVAGVVFFSGRRPLGNDWGQSCITAKTEFNPLAAILGFTVFGVGAAEIMASVQIAMPAGLPFTGLKEAIFTHSTLIEGLIPLFSAVPTK